MFRIDVATAVGVVPTPDAPGTPGFFTRGNPGTSTPATIVSDDWCNMMQEELYNIATALGATPSKTTRNQCLTAINGLIAVGASATAIQAQAGNVGTVGGTANAITATFTPAIGSHITGAPLRVKIATSNTGAVTFNPGAGVKSVVTPQGVALTQGDLIGGEWATFQYDGTNYQYMEATQAQIAQAFSVGLGSNLLIQQNAGTPATQIDVKADRIVLVNPNGVPLTVNATAGFTINAALNGAINRLDTGTLANNTAYDVFMVAKADGTGVGCILTLASNTSTNLIGATTLTTLNGFGYGSPYSCRLGTVVVGAAGAFRRTIQTNRDVQFVVAALPVLGNANVGIGSFTAIPLGDSLGIIPSKAAKIRISVYGNPSTDQIWVAPNNTAYTVGNGTSGFAGFGFGTVSFNPQMVFEFLLESLNIYYASNSASNGVLAVGWTDRVNF